MTNEPDTPTKGQSNLAGTEYARVEPNPVDMYEISYGRGTEYSSRFNRRLQDKRRGLASSEESSESQGDEYNFDKETLELIIVGLVCLVIIEGILLWVK